MSKPTYAVEIGFDVSTLFFLIGRGRIGRDRIGGTSEDGVTWTPITGVQVIRTSRGRQSELDRFEAGKCTVVVDNTSGAFSPENTSSPYYPNVKLMKRLRITATWDGTTYGLFYGQIHRWLPEIRSGLPVVRIEASDLFFRMAGREVNQSFSEQTTGERLAELLTLLKWPNVKRDLNTGKSTLPATTLADTKILQHVEDIIEVEDGQFWMSGEGKATFRDRHARLKDSVSRTSQGTFGGPSGLLYRMGAYDYGVDQVYNEIRVTRNGGTEQVASDDDSQHDYDIRTLSRSSEHFLNDTEAAGLAGWLKGQHRTPIPKLKSITLQGGGDDDLWAQIVSREINDRITVIKEDPNSFGLNRDFLIEGIEHNITNGLNRHETTFALSAADVVNWFQIGHATRGKIGTGRIGY